LQKIADIEILSGLGRFQDITPMMLFNFMQEQGFDIPIP
jgi:hypothetical protein